MPKTHSWYCESILNGDRDAHAFCLLRSPYKKSIHKKVVELCEGHPFREWNIGKVDGNELNQLLKFNIEYDTLYIRDEKEIPSSDKVASNDMPNA